MTPPPTLETMLISRLSLGAVQISYNKPRIANAFSPQTYDELREALLWAQQEPDVNVVLVNGKGKHFCAGRAMGGPADTIEAEIAAGGRLGAVLQPYPKVLIAAIHGASIGWGCTHLELTNFDLVYAHSTAYFQTPFMPLGLVPEGASSYTFPVIMGKPQANALLLAGDRLTAQEAYFGGLVTKVIDGSLDEFEEKVKEIAARVGGYSGEALGMAKRLVREGAGDAEKKKEAGERERRDLVVRFSREDTKERLAAFGNKDKAKM